VHLFQITDEAAIEINKLWDRINGTDPAHNREFIKNVEKNSLFPEGGDGKLIFPK